MEMITVELRKLIPSEGKVLTNGSVYNDTCIYLGVNDSESNWYEITEIEYEEILRKQKEELEAMMPEV